MSLAIQINLNKAAVLDGSTELPTPGAGLGVTKTVDADGVVVLEVANTLDFGAFDPGTLLGSRSGDFVLQSLQVSSSLTEPGGGTNNLALIGPAAPGGGSAPRFVFHNLVSPNGLFEGAQIVPVGYKISILDSSAGMHVVRLTLWPVTRLDQLAGIMT